MVGSSNFIIFNPRGENQETDEQYQLDNAVINGWATAQDATPATFNKAFYQWSTMIYAIGQALASQGFVAQDSDPTGLTAAIISFFTTPLSVIVKEHGTGVPQYVNSTSFTVPYIYEMDSTGVFPIILASTVTVETTGVGLNKLDQGSIAPNTIYNKYTVSNGGTGVDNNGILLSTVNSWVSGVPSNSNFGWTYFRQLPGLVITDGASNILPFTYSGWPYRPSYYFTNYQRLTAPYNIFTNQNPASWTPQSLSAIMPPYSTQPIIHSELTETSNGIGGADAFVRPTGSGLGTGKLIGATEHGPSSAISNFDNVIFTNNSQSFDYQFTGDAGSNRLALDVMGFILNNAQ